MNANQQVFAVTSTAEQQLQHLGIDLPSPPEPFGVYAEAVQTGNLLFLTGICWFLEMKAH